MGPMGPIWLGCRCRLFQDLMRFMAVKISFQQVGWNHGLIVKEFRRPETNSEFSPEN